LISKWDRAVPEGLQAVHKALDVLNSTAERAAFPDTNEGTAELIPWLLDHGGPGRHARPTAGDVSRSAHHHGQLVAATFSDEAPLLPEPLLALCRRLGPALVRAKGFVNVAGEKRRGFLERAGTELTLTFLGPWPPGARRTDLVLIGDDLDPGSLRRQLWACRATTGDETGRD
jgi:G3E family GTPase